MFSQHHHYHHHLTAAAATTTNPAVCHCYSPSPPPPCTHHCPPPPYNPVSQCQCHYQPPPQNHHYFEQQVKLPDNQTHQMVTSLLRRISALESSLRRGSSRQSLRDAAARTIQTHFRAFLARRSRTLAQLKQLASIKSNLNILKSSLSGKTNFNPQALSHRAMDLLIRLDSIQGDDPLIRDGKRSISNELTRFLKLINGVSISSTGIVKNIRNGNKARVRVFSGEFGGNCNEAIDKFVSSVNESEEEDEEHQNPRFSETTKYGVLRNRGGGLARSDGGLKPKVKKSVSFAENGDAYRVFNSSAGNVNGQESFDTEIELMKNLSKRVEKIGMLSKGYQVDEEALTEDGGSSESSDPEMDPNHVSRKDGYYEGNLRDESDNETEGFVFSAPLPVKMEARAADNNINRKKGVKIVEN